MVGRVKGGGKGEVYCRKDIINMSEKDNYQFHGYFQNNYKML